MNNINIDRSTIGVLNTGTIGTLDVALSQLGQSGEHEVSGALKALTEGLAASPDLAAEKKNELLELLSVVASEATAPEASRRRSLVRSLLSEISTHLGGIAALAQLWDQCGPVIRAFFGL